jgi:hypothetical protein
LSWHKIRCLPQSQDSGFQQSTVAYETDYLVTWNCAHIANGEIVRRLREANAELERFTPLIVTPEEILETPGDPDL